MRTENRLDFPVPSDTRVCDGFSAAKIGLLTFKASPGDLVVEVINNSPHSEYLGITKTPHYMPYEFSPNYLVKAFKVRGRSGCEYMVEVSDVCLYVVETKTVLTYCDVRGMRFKNISSYLNDLIL